MNKINVENRFHLSPFFKDKFVLISLVSLLSLFLGVVTAALGLAMGPAFELLFSDRNLFQVSELFGPQIEAIWSWFGWSNSFSKEQAISTLPFALAGLAFFKFASTFSIFYFWEWFSESIAFVLRNHIVEQFLRARPERLFSDSGRSLGNAMPSVIANDLRQVRQYIVRFFGSMPREIFQVVFLVTAMILLSPKLFGYFILAVAPCAIVIQKIGKKVKRRSRIVLENFSGMSDWLLKRILGFETIKQMKTESFEVEKMTERSRILTSKYFAVARAKSVSAPLVEAVSISALGLVLYLSYLMISEQTASASTQISFFSCLALLAQASAKFGRYVNIGAEGQAALKKLKEFDRELISTARTYDSSREVSGSNQTEVRVSDLVKELPGGFTLRVPKAEFKSKHWYGIEGKSGSGKSTFLSVLSGQLEEFKGRIDLSVSKKETSVCPVVYLNQDFQPFFGTVLENVCYPLQYKDVLRPRILKALEDAAWSSDSGLCLEDNVGFGSASLSGGQLQRLGLARLFFHQPQIALLDECTSALDQETEKQVLASINKLVSAGACVIMTAHRPSALKVCTNTLTFEKGAIVHV